MSEEPKYELVQCDVNGWVSVLRAKTHYGLMTPGHVFPSFVGKTQKAVLEKAIASLEKQRSELSDRIMALRVLQLSLPNEVLKKTRVRKKKGGIVMFNNQAKVETTSLLLAAVILLGIVAYPSITGNPLTYEQYELQEYKRQTAVLERQAAILERIAKVLEADREKR